MEHTPTPWRVAPRTSQYGVSIVAGDDSKTVRVTSIYGSDGLPDTQDEINATFIVEAVNSHEQLKKAVETALTHCERSHWAGADDVAEALRSALGK